MFDFFTIETAPEYTHHTSEVSVTEKKAPTDESLRLLKEMREKARESITFDKDLEDNGFKFRATIYERFEEGTMVCQIKFKLNGRIEEFEVEQSRYESQRQNEHPERLFATKILDAVRERVSKTISENIIHLLMSNNKNNHSVPFGGCGYTSPTFTAKYEQNRLWDIEEEYKF